jgi:hypothetical protein
MIERKQLLLAIEQIYNQHTDLFPFSDDRLKQIQYELLLGKYRWKKAEIKPFHFLKRDDPLKQVVP